MVRPAQSTETNVTMPLSTLAGPRPSITSSFNPTPKVYTKGPTLASGPSSQPRPVSSHAESLVDNVPSLSQRQAARDPAFDFVKVVTPSEGTVEEDGIGKT